MKKHVIFFILIMLLNCEKKQRSLEYQIGDMADYLLDSGAWSPILLACGGNEVITSYTEFIDMNDGTIKKQDYSHTHDNCHIFPDTTNYYNIYYIKKCLQGQVYRPTQNDCQGTGAAPDWGAVRYQFCPTNDRACDMMTTNDSGNTIYVADPTLSPAAKACADDTTAGRIWTLIREIGINYGYIFPSNISAYMPEIPKGNTNLIWTDFAKDQTKSNAYFFDSVSGLEAYFSGGLLKNTSQFILCISK